MKLIIKLRYHVVRFKNNKAINKAIGYDIVVQYIRRWIMRNILF